MLRVLALLRGASCVLALGATVVAPTCHACDDLLFSTPTYAVGYFPTAIAKGDFNGDGLDDLVAANSSASPELNLLLATGGGTFTVSAMVGSGLACSSVAVGDFDQDGAQDVAKTLASMSTVSVFLGGGDGSFVYHSDFGSGADTLPVDVVVGDFNVDGMPDLATANGDANTVTILRGHGDGGFEAIETVTVSKSVTGLVAEDLDADGRLELATANYTSGTVSVLQEHGLSGTYTVSQTYAVDPYPLTIAAGDFDGDAAADLVIGSLSAAGASILLGQGDGSFIAGPPDGSEGSAWFVGPEDFDGDGLLDLATTQTKYVGGTVSILLGQGDATFAAHGPFEVGVDPHSAAVGDFNGDGRPDVATADESSPGAVSILLGLGNGDLQANSAFDTGNGPTGLVATDLDGDGTPDLATADALFDTLTVLIGDGQGAFTADFTLDPGDGPTDLATGDFNGDGLQDLATTNATLTPSVNILLGEGAGAFSGVASFGVAAKPQRVFVGEFTGDGVPDLVTSHDSSSATATVLLGVGDGTFVSNGTGGIDLKLYSAALGDFDDDGWQDLAATVAGSSSVTILKGQGDGSFSVAGSFDVGAPVGQVVMGDFNADGSADLAGLSYDDSAVARILLGNGDGSFAYNGAFGLGWPGAGSLVAQDFDADGSQDLAATCGGVSYQATGSASILLGDGTGGFALNGSYGMAEGAANIVAGDFNGDGRRDLAATSSNTNTVSVLLNQLPSTWLDLGSGLSGLSGVPSLAGEGDLTPGSGGAVTLSSAAPSTTAVLFLSVVGDPVPFKCGSLVPTPVLASLPAHTSPGGEVVLAWPSWPAGASGLSIYWQYAVHDSAAVCGVSLSNALRSDVP